MIATERPSVLAVGRIVGAHGLKGDLKVALLTDFPRALVRRTELLVGENHRQISVASARVSGPAAVFHLAGVESREEADALRGEFLYVPVAQAHRPRGEYFVHELIGMEVWTAGGARLGTIADVLKTGANDVYVVRDDAGEHLIPAIADIVKAIDTAAGRVVVHLIPGLLRGD